MIGCGNARGAMEREWNRIFLSMAFSGRRSPSVHPSRGTNMWRGVGETTGERGNLLHAARSPSIPPLFPPPASVCARRRRLPLLSSIWHLGLGRQLEMHQWLATLASERKRFKYWKFQIPKHESPSRRRMREIGTVNGQRAHWNYWDRPCLVTLWKSFEENFLMLWPLIKCIK